MRPSTRRSSAVACGLWRSRAVVCGRVRSCAVACGLPRSRRFLCGPVRSSLGSSARFSAVLCGRVRSSGGRLRSRAGRVRSSAVSCAISCGRKQILLILRYNLLTPGILTENRSVVCQPKSKRSTPYGCCRRSAHHRAHRPPCMLVWTTNTHTCIHTPSRINQSH